MAITTNEIQMILSAQDRTASAFSSLERKLGASQASTEKFSKGLSLVGKGFAAKVIIDQFSGISAGLLSSSIEVEKYGAALKNAVGGGDAFSIAQSNIERQLNGSLSGASELTQSYQKLANLGLNPTLDGMRAFEEVAVGSAKSLDQLIEAVADASTGEFERLKEFGIKSKKQGEDVEFTFRGMTTTVKNSSEEITGYLEGLGKSQFVGSIAAQLDTLSGSQQSFNKQVSLATTEIVELFGVLDKGKDAYQSFADLVQGARIALRGQSSSFAEAEESVAFYSKELEEAKTAAAALNKEGDFYDSYLSSITKKIERLTESRDRELGILEKLSAANTRLVASQTRQSEVSDEVARRSAGAIKALDDRMKAEEKAAEVAQKIDQQVSKRVEALQREIAIFGQSTAAAKAYYAVQNGGLSGASDQIKQNYINSAKQLDSLKTQAAVQKEFNRLLEQSTSPIQKIASDFAAAQDVISAANASRAENEKVSFDQRLQIMQDFGEKAAGTLSSSLSAGSIVDLAQLDAVWEKNKAKLDELRSGELANEELYLSARNALRADYDAQADAIHQAALTKRQAENKELLRQIQQLEASNRSPLQVETDAYSSRQQVIDQARLDNLISQGKHHALLQGAEQRHQESMLRIYKQNGGQTSDFLALSADQQKDIMIGSYKNIASAMAGESRSAFEINKAFAISDIAQSSRKAIMNAYAWGSKYGGPLGGALAAAPAAAFGLSQLKSVKDQSFGSGSAATTSAGSGSSSVGSDSSDTIDSARGNDSGGNVAPIYYLTVNALDAQTAEDGVSRALAFAQKSNRISSDGRVIDYSYGT